MTISGSNAVRVMQVNVGSLTLNNVTIANGNTAGNGGGIYQGNSTTVTLLNTIVANNTGGNCYGTFTNGGNKIDSGTTCGWGSANGLMSDTDPLLGPLADNNGRLTETMALLTGSLAIDGVTYNSQ